MLSGSIAYLRGTRRKRVPIYQVTSLIGLRAFAVNTDALTNAQPVRIVASEVAYIEGGAQAVTGMNYDTYYAIFQFRNTAPDEGENKWREFPLPDPSAGIFEIVGGKLQIKPSIGGQVATWFSALTGKPYEFVKGWLRQG